MNVLKKLIFLMLLAAPMLVLNSCSKSDNPAPGDPPGPAGFTAADFKLTIDEFYEPGDDYPGEDYLRIEYTVKNISSKNLPEGVNVLWKVRAADGAYYETLHEDIVYADPLNAGASIKTAAVIKLGVPHNNADKTTLTYTLTP